MVDQQVTSDQNLYFMGATSSAPANIFLQNGHEFATTVSGWYMIRFYLAAKENAVLIINPAVNGVPDLQTSFGATANTVSYAQYPIHLMAGDKLTFVYTQSIPTILESLGNDAVNLSVILNLVAEDAN